MRKAMSVVQGGSAQCYTWLGVAYLIVVSALHWSRGGPPMQGPGTGSMPGAANDLLAFYGAWYGVGLILLGLGWWRAAHGDHATR